MYREISKEEILREITKSKSRRDLIVRLGLPQTGTANKFVKDLLQKYNISEESFYNPFAKSCRISTITAEELQKIVNESFTYKEVLGKLGYSNAVGSSYRTLKDKIRALNIDTSCLTHRAIVPFRKNKKEDIFCENSTVTQGCLRARVIKDNIIPYVCAICGNKGEWNGKPLTLTLDHKNGDRTDNRVDNLRFICPNCDRQQDTYGSKNKTRYYNK